MYHVDDDVCLTSFGPNTRHIAANDPATVMADIDEILRLRAQVERLKKEAAALTENVGKFCDACSNCDICPCGDCCPYSEDAMNAIGEWCRIARDTLEKKEEVFIGASENTAGMNGEWAGPIPEPEE